MREEKATVAKELQELRQRFDDAELEKKIAERKSQQMVRCTFPSSFLLRTPELEFCTYVIFLIYTYRQLIHTCAYMHVHVVGLAWVLRGESR